jgi:hypothetical protein
MMVSKRLIKYVTLKIEGEPATHTKSPKAENPVRRGVALANVAAPLISDLILKEPALPAAHSRCPVRASRRMAASPVLHPSFETLAEFIIGPRFARTRWQAPQDEVVPRWGAAQSGNEREAVPDFAFAPSGLRIQFQKAAPSLRAMRSNPAFRGIEENKLDCTSDHAAHTLRTGN